LLLLLLLLLLTMYWFKWRCHANDAGALYKVIDVYWEQNIRICLGLHTDDVGLSIQEAQLMLTNLRDAFRDQSRSPNI